MPPQSKPLVRIYANKPGYSELRYHVAGVVKREVVPDAHVRVRAQEITGQLASHQVPLRPAEVEEYRAVKFMLPEGVTLLQVVSHYLATGPRTKMSWPEALVQFKVRQKTDGISKDLVRDRLALLHKFQGFCTWGKLAFDPSQVLEAHVRSYLATANSDKTANNWRSHLLVFFDWYRTETRTPVSVEHPVRSVKARRVAVVDPVPFTPDALQKLLHTAQEESCAASIMALALGAFCGIRMAEIERLKWSDLYELDGSFSDVISLSSTITKTNRRRTIPVTPEAKQWFSVGYLKTPSWLRSHDCPVLNGKIHDKLSAIARKAEVEWIPNGLRKGFVSASVALHGTAKTAAWAGHSEAVLESTYKALVSVEDATKWFSIRPK